MDTPGFEMLRGDVFHVLWRGRAEHEDFDRDILEAGADDGDEFWEVLLVGQLDFQGGSHHAVS